MTKAKAIEVVGSTQKIVMLANQLIADSRASFAAAADLDQVGTDEEIFQGMVSAILLGLHYACEAKEIDFKSCLDDVDLWREHCAEAKKVLFPVQ